MPPLHSATSLTVRSPPPPGIAMVAHAAAAAGNAGRLPATLQYNQLPVMFFLRNQQFNRGAVLFTPCSGLLLFLDSFLPLHSRAMMTRDREGRSCLHVAAQAAASSPAAQSRAYACFVVVISRCPCLLLPAAGSPSPLISAAACVEQ